MSAEPLIIDRVEVITPAWLTRTLRDWFGAIGNATNGLEVVGVDATPVGTGQMSDSLRLDLRYGGERPPGAPESVIAKLPASDPVSRATGVATRAYETEIRFYRELAPSLPIRTPVVYHAELDPVSGSFVLILEDLHPARQGDQLAGCSVAEAEVALEQLVGLHAPRWGDPTLAESWLRSPGGGMAEILPALWDGWQARFDGRFAPDVRAAGDALIASVGALERRPTLHRSTIVHNDYRLDNLLFGAADGRPTVAVVDWQSVGVGRGATDVAYFLGSGLVEAARREHEERLVRGYHRSLLTAGVTDGGWEQLWLEYRAGAFAGLAMTVAAAMLVQQTPRGDEMLMTMARRHACHVLDLDAAGAMAELTSSGHSD